MESKNSPEKKYKNKAKTYIDINNIRKVNENKYLTLRKQKRRHDLNKDIKSKLNLLYEHQYFIHLNLLKTDNDDIRNFYINLTNIELTMKNLKYLLCSNDDDEVKYGLYSIRKFFQNLLSKKPSEEIKNNEININSNEIQSGNKSNDFQIKLNGIKTIPLIKVNKLEKEKNDIMIIFLENNIIDYLFEIIKKNLNKNEKKYQINIYESFWIFINMSAINLLDEYYINKFNSSFTQDDNLMILLDLIEPQKYPQEIILNVLILLGNISYENPTIREVLIKSSLTPVLFNFLKNAEKLNSQVIFKIIRLLYILYEKCEYELNLEAYKLLYKVFSLCLKSFNNDDIINYCLEILLMLSKKDIPEVINCFDDLELMRILNDIIMDKPIVNNEININTILDIFCNLISGNNKLIRKDIIDPGFLTIFYNNLIKKYKDENIVMDYKVEENILVSCNNLIYFNHEDNIKYIFGDGKEILDFFLQSAKSVFPRTRFQGLQSLVNILYEIEIDINVDILNEIINSIIQTLDNDFGICYYICLQCLDIIIRISKKKNLDNNLRIHLINHGISDLIEKVKIKLLNDAQKNVLAKEEILNYDNFIIEINEFLESV